MADLTTVAPMLKEVWQQGHEVSFNQDIIGLSRIEKTSDGMVEDLSGRYVVIPLKVRRNQGLGSRPERGILPLPGHQGYVGTRVTVRTQYGVGEITAQTLHLVDGNPRAAISAIDEELEGLRDDFNKDYSRQVYGNATGILATVTAVAGNVVTVSSAQFVDLEQRVDAVDTTGPTVTSAGRLILDVNEDTKEVTLDNATGVAVGNILVRAGNYNQEINGFSQLISATLPTQNLSPAAERLWKSTEINPGAHAYNEAEIIKAFHSVRLRAGAAKQPTVMFTDLGVERAAFALLSQSREFVNTVEFGHGYSALPFNVGSKTVPMVADPDYPTAIDAVTGSILGVHEPSVKLYREDRGLHWAEETGSMFLAAQDRSDAWEFRLRQHSQLGIKQRNTHFRISGITRA
jgi:hypothetical protein